MSEAKPIDKESAATDIKQEAEILTDEMRKEIRSSNVHENFKRADEARTKLRDHLAKAEYKDGTYDFSNVEGMTETEGYEIAQNFQAIFNEIVHSNNQKLMSDSLSQTTRSTIPGSPPMQMFDAATNGGIRDVFTRFQEVHGLDVDKIFDTYKFNADRATVDDFLMAAGSSNTGAITRGGPGIGGGNIGASPVAGNDNYLTPPGLTWTGGSTAIAPQYSTSGVPVERYLSQMPAQMHLRRRDYLTPMIQRIPCPPITDTLRYISEEMASGAPGSSNRVAGRQEGMAAPVQDMSTREIHVQVVKRMIAATITNEQTTDTIQARQIMHDNILIKIQEDFEDQIVNGNDTTGINMEGLFWKAARGTQSLDQLKANSSHFKQTITRGANDVDKPLDFFLECFTQYLKPRPDHGQNQDGSDTNFGAGRSPTHLVLPLAEKMRLMKQKDNQGRYLWANTVEGDFVTLWGMPIVTSDFIPNEKGLILALDELAIVVKAGVEWNFGLKDDDLTRDQSTMVAKHRANVLCKRPRSVMILENLAGD